MKNSAKAVIVAIMYIIIFSLVCVLYGIPETLEQFVGIFMLSIVFSALYFAVGPLFSLLVSVLIGDRLFTLLRRICKSDSVARDAQFFSCLLLGLFLAAGFLILIGSFGSDHGPSILEKYRL